jgi:phosphoglycolate phosphatase
MPAPRLLVWDFDGTLADTFVAIRVSTAAALAAHGLPMCTDEALRGTIGWSLADGLAHLAADPDANPVLVASLVATYRESFASAGHTHASLFPGVIELLGDLGDQRVTSAIATSRMRASVEQLIDRLGLAPHIAEVQSTGDLPPGQAKPHPEVVLRACAALGHNPAGAVVIGDAPVDIGMGRAAGAATIAVTWGNGTRPALAAAGPTHVVDTLDDLRALITG